MNKSTIKIEILDDFRCFKKGDVFEIDIERLGITYIVGNNGSGKSTLLHSFRLLSDSLEKTNKDRADGIKNTILERVKNEVLPKIKIDGFDYDEIYSLDSVVDDPNSLENCATAYSFVAAGGYASQRASKGQKAVFLLSRYIKDVKAQLNKLPKKDLLSKKRLFIIDEADEGLDLRLQFKYNTILENKFCSEYLGDVIVVSHNAICMLSDSLIKPCVFDIDKKQMTKVEDYINDKTEGEYSIQIIKNKVTNGSE